MLPQPVMLVAPSLKAIEPVGEIPPFTVAVNVTLCPNTLGLAEEFRPVLVAPVIGVTLLEGPPAGPGPIPFVAFTMNVYGVPFVSPVTFMEVQGTLQEPVILPGVEVAA